MSLGPAAGPRHCPDDQKGQRLTASDEKTCQKLDRSTPGLRSVPQPTLKLFPLVAPQRDRFGLNLRRIEVVEKNEATLEQKMTALIKFAREWSDRCV